MTYVACYVLSAVEPPTHPQLRSWNYLRGKKEEEEEVEEEETEEQWGRKEKEEGKVYEEGVAVRGWVSMKIYVLKSSCKMFNVSMNVLCL